jgi:hypothetical protein
MKLSKPEVVGLGGIDLTNWDFGETLLDIPGAVPHRDLILHDISETLRYVLANDAPLSVRWKPPGSLEIALMLGDVTEQGWVEWTLPVTDVLEAVADGIASGEMPKRTQRDIATALEVTATRIRSGEYRKKQK